jgi:YgiT-type zinc finger domain-containing protein
MANVRLIDSKCKSCGSTQTMKDEVIPTVEKKGVGSILVEHIHVFKCLDCGKRSWIKSSLDKYYAERV